VGAGEDGAVRSGVALAAVEGAVFAGVQFVEPLLVVVAGDAGRPQLRQRGQVQFERLVRVVAAGAIIQGEMPALGAQVAVAAVELGGCAVRQMLRMAGGAAGKSVLVPLPFGGQRCDLLCMAGLTVVFRDVDRLAELDILRLMWRVAVQTIPLGHRFFMRLVTVEALAQLGVITVAVGAVLLAVPAGHGGELIRDLLMAADADRTERLTLAEIDG
jgi:hypothetical protein